jgi:hypothetical protein
MSRPVTVVGTNPVSLPDAVIEFGISRATLGKLIREGRLARYSKVGDRRGFVDRDELRELLEFRKDKPVRKG